MSRILVMGDIHGNLPALEKLFLLEPDIDKVICNGDVVNYGPWSNECVQMLASVGNCICLKGNHERYFLEGSYNGTNKLVIDFFDFCYARFNQWESIKLYLESTKAGDYTVQHTLADRYIFSDTDVGSIDRNYIIGHSHQQFERTINNYSLINTGSVGQNRKFINVADYLIYDVDSKKVLLKSFKYDVELIISKMKSEGYPQQCIDYYSLKDRL